MPQELSPALRRFQELKAKERHRAIERATMRAEIKAANPKATDKQVEQIIEAHLRSKQVQVIKVRRRSVQVQYS